MCRCADDYTCHLCAYEASLPRCPRCNVHANGSDTFANLCAECTLQVLGSSIGARSIFDYGAYYGALDTIAAEIKAAERRAAARAIADASLDAFDALPSRESSRIPKHSRGKRGDGLGCRKHPQCRHAHATDRTRYRSVRVRDRALRTARLTHPRNAWGCAA